MKNKLDKFKIGNGYYSDLGGPNLECIKRTDKTVTFRYDDGEEVTKRIKIWYGFSCDYEYVVFDGIKVKAQKGVGYEKR